MTLPVVIRSFFLKSWVYGLIALSGFCVTYAARDWRISGGDTILIFQPQWQTLLWREGVVWYAREPLSHLFVHCLYSIIGHGDDHAVIAQKDVFALGDKAFIRSLNEYNPDWIVANKVRAFSLMASICAGLYFALMAWFAKNRWRLWLVCLVSAANLNFIGHLEFYAPTVVAMALFFILLGLAFEPDSKINITHVCGAFGLAWLFHKGILFFSPALIWLAVRIDTSSEQHSIRWKLRRWQGRQAEWGVALILLAALIDILPGALYSADLIPWLYYHPVNEPLMTLITPFTQGMARYFESKSITGMFYIYTFGEPLHWAYFFSFLVASSPIGLGLLIWMSFKQSWRSRLFGSDSARALATATICGIIWILFWHPRAFWRDWDLFCLIGIPFGLWIGGIWAGRWTSTDKPVSLKPFSPSSTL